MPSRVLARRNASTEPSTIPRREATRGQCPADGGQGVASEHVTFPQPGRVGLHVVTEHHAVEPVGRRRLLGDAMYFHVQEVNNFNL